MVVELSGLIHFSMLIHVAISKSTFILNSDASKIIELNVKDDFCLVHVDKFKIQEKLSNSDKSLQTQMPDAFVNEFVEICNNSTKTPRIDRATRDVMYGIGFTYPKTLWCGPGNTANNYWELGENPQVDACCRMHDHCPIHKVGLITISHCDCDNAFYNCLKAANSPLADKIGNIYFNVLGMYCYVFVPPCIQGSSPIDKPVCQERDVPPRVY
ncbi:uncharacterized protein LOC130895415 [Diorhabda carinulata]|uniref:uncharacterized protein LOC130895415 n=1 Tax=Diorhabda carinulata TaxID=1163345 RepID=UPI0025A1A046|nr:uncharacterized protein LOC130895415 [Diorhabda carinulata]